MITKYNKLTTHLNGLVDAEWHTSFDDLERILAFSLPPSARAHKAWWANQENSSQSRSWMVAGWKTTSVDVIGESVTFRKCQGVGAHTASVREHPPGAPGLTIPMAKEGLALRFGVDTSIIRISIEA